jgi:hypothetical protein
MHNTCNPCGDPKGQGNALAAPRRNRYFYGKLLDVPHMQMEQDYGKLKRWLLNRLAVGSGVLCGLDVYAKDGKICVSPGVALDTFGREIIVPGTYCIDPWLLPDECGNPQKELDRHEKHLIQLRICYRECVTDYAPAQVSDCNSKAACEAGTTMESFQFQILEEPYERPPFDCDLMHLDEQEKKDVTDVPAFIRQRLCEKLPHPCLGDKECCVLLAVIELLPDGKFGKIETCSVRTVLYSNAMLFEMILCLAECCGPHAHPTAPPTSPPTSPPTPPPTLAPTVPPTPPPPTQPPAPTLRVKAVEILDVGGAVMKTLATPGDVVSVPSNKKPFSIRVTFNIPEIKATVVTGDYTPVQNSKSFSFLVESTSERYLPQDYVPGKLTFPAPNVVRFDLAFGEFQAFFAGKYKVTLFAIADPTPGINRPAISSQSDSSPLDGQPELVFPTGDGVPGGSFVCQFVVT